MGGSFYTSVYVGSCIPREVAFVDEDETELHPCLKALPSCWVDEGTEKVYLQEPEGDQNAYVTAYSTVTSLKSGWEAQCFEFDFEADREKVKAVLEPHGLWDEEEFGVWVVSKVSV